MAADTQKGLGRETDEVIAGVMAEGPGTLTLKLAPMTPME